MGRSFDVVGYALLDAAARALIAAYLGKQPCDRAAEAPLFGYADPDDLALLLARTPPPDDVTSDEYAAWDMEYGRISAVPLGYYPVAVRELPYNRPDSDDVLFAGSDHEYIPDVYVDMKSVPPHVRMLRITYD